MPLPDDYRFAHWVPQTVKESVRALAAPCEEDWSERTHHLVKLTRSDTSRDLTTAFKTLCDSLKRQYRDDWEARLGAFLQAVVGIPLPKPNIAPPPTASEVASDFEKLIQDCNDLAKKLRSACSQKEPARVLTDPKLTSVLRITDSALGDIALFDALREYATQLQGELDARKPVRGQDLHSDASLAWVGPPLSTDEGANTEINNYARHIQACVFDHLNEPSPSLVAAIVSAMTSIPFSKQRVDILYK